MVIQQFCLRLNSVSPLTIETQTALLDLLLIHQPAGKYAAGYRQMEKAYKAGKVHAIGLSNFNKAQIEELLSLCEVNPTVLQTELHPYHQKLEMKAFLKENGIVPQAWYTLEHGDKALLQANFDRFDFALTDAEMVPPVDEQKRKTFFACPDAWTDIGYAEKLHN